MGVCGVGGGGVGLWSGWWWWWVVKLVVVLMVGTGLGGVLMGVGWVVYEVIVGDGVLGGGLLLEI